jgi:1-aminocyclopropane-1-carboxylate deaminase/D-cysteine desulfhydrase-like pyridoxal-dependent ACC family enzyme
VISNDLRDHVALFRWLPQLARRVPWVSLGSWPTPLVEARVSGRALWIKREGDSSTRYGGNKVRTLEAWLGHALARNARRIWAIGAYGSNHAIATILHAHAVGLKAGAILFPQPASEWAIENAGAMIAARVPLVRLRSVVQVPFAGLAIARNAPGALVMPPGGATPIGTLGALSAALELAEQLTLGLAPLPARIVVPAGSTCTTAGLLAGLALARALGAWRGPLPIVHAVRVTPWPVTSRTMILQLAALTLLRIARLGGPHVPLRRLPSLVVDGHELGDGYGQMTRTCDAAIHALAGSFPRLDGVYSGKAAAALLRLHHAHEGPLLFWATKSEAHLDAPDAAALAHAPRALVEWMR